MEIPRQLPKYTKPLSIRIADVLDDVGASEEFRWYCVEAAVNNEILETLIARLPGCSVSCYIFGSSAEGTTTYGLQSDVDRLMSKDNWEVFQDETEINKSNPVSLLLVEDNFTKPGYAKLQMALNGFLQSNEIPDLDLPPKEIQLDSKGRAVMSKRYYIASLHDEEHGPAFSVPASPGYAAKDMVQAFRCRKWPSAATKWFQRVMGHDWPTEETVNKMKTCGFFLVPVGHPHSKENNVEWRISLSEQERMLVESFNPTQFKCYILLKMIKKDILPQLVGKESLTSYHCKTCLFYMLENTPASLWTPDNLLACLQGCLECLLQWTTNGSCPNYFIPEENMFDGRVSGDVLESLKGALQTLTSSNFEYLLQIKSDGFGTKLYGRHTDVINRDTSGYQSAKLFMYLRRYPSLLMARNAILNLCLSIWPVNVPHAYLNMLLGQDRTHTFSEHSHDVLQSLLNTIRDLNRTDTITEHSREETRRAVNLVVPYVELSFLSTLIAKEASSSKENEKLWKYLACNKWRELRHSSDLLSSRLKQATLMYMLGFTHESFEILDYLLELISYPPYIVSVCYCRKFVPARSTPSAALESVEDDFEWFHCHNVAPCVVFLPSEQPLIPIAMLYETIRSAGMPSYSRHVLKDCWYDWVVVDGKFLLYFLLYLHYK